MNTPSADVNNPQYVVTLTNLDDQQTVGIITSSRTNLRRLPRGAGVERKAVTQLDWSGGRGIDRASDDATRYADGMNVFTHISGQVTNGPLAVLTSIRNGYLGAWKPNYFVWSPSLPDSPPPHAMKVYGKTFEFPGGSMARSFTPSTSFTARRLVLPIMRNTDAGTQFTVAIYSGSNSPSTALWSTSSSLQIYPEDLAPRCLILDPNLAVTAGTKYWLVVTIADTCYYQIGLDFDGAAYPGKVKWTGASTWSNFNFAPIFYLTEADTDYTRIHFFEYKRALYAMPQLASGASSNLLINGDRGVATGTQSTSTVADSTKAWTVNQWAGCVVYISNGANKGQSRTIASNTGTTLTLADALPIACATGAGGSEYVILGSDKWTAISSGLAAACTDVDILNDICYLATGAGHAIRRMREYNNGGTWTREFADDGANDADLIMAGAHWQSAEQALYRARNSNGTVSIAKKVAWGTNLTFETDIDCGNKESMINGLCRYNMAGGYYAYVGKEDGIYALRDGKFAEIEIGMQWSRDERNGCAISGWMTNLYFSFLDGFERLYGQVVDDIGPNRDSGLPAERRGRVADVRTVMNQMFAAYDGGAKARPNTGFVQGLRTKNFSQIFSTTSPGGDWHEVFRGWEDGQRITDIFYQPIPGQINRLWFRYGADIGYLIMPDTINPLNDSNMRYAPASCVVTGWFDLGTPELDHYFDQLRLTVLNTRSETHLVRLDYQTYPDRDKTYSTPTWRHVDTVGGEGMRFLVSPIGDGKLTGSKIRFRLTLCGDTVTPLILKSYELRADTMNEVLYDYQFDFILNDNEMLMNGDDTSLRAVDIYQIIESWKEDATPLRMRVSIPGVGTVFDGVLGHIDPVSLVTLEWSDRESSVAGNISFKQTGQYAMDIA